MPSLAELGAFDLPPPAARRPGRLTDEDLRGVPARPPGVPGTARPETEPPSRAPLRPPGAGGAGAVSAAAKPVSWPGLRPGERSPPAAAAPHGATLPPGAGRSAVPAPPPPAPAGPPPASPKTRTVPGVTVGWADLEAAVAAGWMKPEAAHALWARWLARKPLTHLDAPEGAEAGPPPAVQPAPGLPPAAEAALDAAAPQAAASAAARAAPGVADAIPPRPADAAATSDGARPRAGAAGAEPAGAAAARAGARAEPEVLEPLHEARARRAAERAEMRPRIEVVDVIEVPAPGPARLAAPASAALQFGAALLAAVAAAFCIGVGAVVFGPWGGVAAALGCTSLAWHRTGLLHRRGRLGPALSGAHVVLMLVAATIWQLQTAMGWWPADRPMELFADVPGSAGASAQGIRLDWRWLALAGGALLAAFFWLVRLRHPALLGAVTVLLWGVAYQAVAGVLQSLGLAFHGMSTFTLLLGSLTLAAALYVDLRVRRAGVADFARWPYLGGALLLGVGWVSLAVLPGWVLLPRYLGWVLFLLWALSLQRVAMMGVALALAGFELAWSAARVSGSNLVGLVLWTVWLAGVGGAVNFLWPRRQAWSAPLRSWMPRAWREVFAPAATPGSGEGAAAAPRAGMSKARA